MNEYIKSWELAITFTRLFCAWVDDLDHWLQAVVCNKCLSSGEWEQMYCDTVPWQNQPCCLPPRRRPCVLQPEESTIIILRVPMLSRVHELENGLPIKKHDYWYKRGGGNAPHWFGNQSTDKILKIMKGNHTHDAIKRMNSYMGREERQNSSPGTNVTHHLWVYRLENLKQMTASFICMQLNWRWFF